MEIHLPLPADVRKAVGAEPLNSRHTAACSNFGLRFQTYLGFPEPWAFGADRKSEAWKQIVQDADGAFQAMEEHHRHLLRRREQLVEALRRGGGPEGVRVFTGTVAWRAAVGLGAQHPLENGFTLHRIHGIPYLPASSLKGLARRWKLAELAETHGVPAVADPKELETPHKKRERTTWERFEDLVTAKEGEKQAQRLRPAFDRLSADLGWGPKGLTLEAVRAEAESYRRAFGTQAARGEVCFVDAYPEALQVKGKPILTLDVVNPHYGEYYAGKSYPVDYLSPVPSHFLALRKGARFRFIVYGREPGLVAQATAWLQGALRDLGVGGKTSAGYGEISFPSEPR